MVLEISIVISDDEDEDVYEDRSIILEKSADNPDVFIDASKMLPEVMDAIREVLKKHPEIDFTVCG